MNGSKWPCFWCGSMQAHETGWPGGMSTVPACAEHAAEFTQEKAMQMRKEVMARTTSATGWKCRCPANQATFGADPSVNDARVARCTLCGTDRPSDAPDPQPGPVCPLCGTNAVMLDYLLGPEVYAHATCIVAVERVRSTDYPIPQHEGTDAARRAARDAGWNAAMRHAAETVRSMSPHTADERQLLVDAATHVLALCTDGEGS